MIHRRMVDTTTSEKGLTGVLVSMNRVVRLIASFAAGALTALGQAPWGLWAAALIGLTAIFLLIATTRGAKAAFWTGWVAGAGYFGLGMFWIVEPFLVDAARHGWMAPFAVVFLAGGLALFWGAAGALARWLGHSPRDLAVAWSAAMVLAELARGYVLTGFPWALLAYGWLDTPVMHWAKLTGSYGLSFLTLVLIGLTARILLGALPRSLIMPMAGWAALVAGGAVLTPDAQDLTDRPIVRVVQPNAPQDEKWDPTRARAFFDRAVAFTGAEAEVTPALAVWPESALPTFLENAEPAFEIMARAAQGMPVVTGLQRRDDMGVYNSMVVLGPNGEVTDLYDKHHLVPLGEYIPFRNLAARVGLRGLSQRGALGYTPGTGARVLEISGLGTALPLICYEGIFPHDVNAAPERPDFILLITNDAWFGEAAGPQQHLAQARVRAIEQGLPMIRSANTGISTVIDPAGRTLGTVPVGEAGFLDLPLPRPLRATIYSWTGDWPVFALVLALLTAVRVPSGSVRREETD